jgi:thioredoxin reductase (NADPH)
MSRIVHVAGWTPCSFFRKAKAAMQGLELIFPSQIACDLTYEFATRDEYKAWLATRQDLVGKHTSSPFVWIGDKEVIGGHDDTMTWIRKFVKTDDKAATNSDASANIDSGYTADHGFQYDVIVIGGGSGGLACSKELAQLGANVVCLDYVKPSPAGTTWGLGGTCVNVGCIPKKLMHTAALMGEARNHSEAYGWNTTTTSTAAHSWETLKSSVQDHIKGLNFGYRVSLREQGVTYMNKLGRFVGPNTLEVTDKKGKVDTITAARFVVAVGGRPTPLSIPGGEHALSSDDLFSLETPPGKTCIIGAGYVALECAGFISGMGMEAHVCIRSVPLRGFDRDMVDMVVSNMEKTHATKFINSNLPISIEKQADHQLKVTFTDGTSDTYNSVLCATGRYADISGLGLENVNVKTNPKTGKIICTNEQSSTSHIYAIGDVIDGAPELTPVAIQAGRLLAKRLQGKSVEPMDYTKVATTVFTPLEFGTVGLTEDEAVAAHCSSTVDSYISEFTPLEWTIIDSMSDKSCFAKVVIHKKTTQVLGIHIASPNAGEIIQGFAVALRKGTLMYSDLTDTIGIHPTVAEELVSLSVTKSSGESTKSSGC